MSSQQSSQEEELQEATDYFDPSGEEESQRINIGSVSIFSYEELQEATKFFNPSGVVGEGGFGIVYRGKLGDGRTVAVKDLHVRHPKQIEQFKTEVTVLSSIRHQNLVSLYGFTNPESRKLLLVYEFVPNGTLAGHLHGGLVSLSWDTRIRVAVEAAEALFYLHSLHPPVIHRDIKTDNILLDNNFTVKVADLGSCRPLPWDAVHVSTMPQGTQGYLDPEYYQCLKLTDKSDVYSFGVVLLELISGKKAFDTEDRDGEEIWLSRMALNKMMNQEMEQLVDPELGYCSDLKMRSMVDSVTKLALRCLKPKGDMRPAMVEILTTLKTIRDGKIMCDDDVSSAQFARSNDSSSAFYLPETPLPASLRRIQKYELRICMLLERMTSNLFFSIPCLGIATAGTQKYWKPPAVGRVKLNTDGTCSCSGNGQISTGGLIRDAGGHWLIGYSKYIGSGNALLANLWSLRDGLKMAWDYGYNNVEVECGSITIVNILYSSVWKLIGLPSAFCGTYHMIKSLLIECQALMNRNWHCSVRHILREANSAADHLAKLGQVLQLDMMVYNDAPASIHHILEYDCK